VQYAQIDRPIMVPIAGFSEKSTPFNIYLQFVHISSFFHIFPKLCGADRFNGTAPYASIALASARRPADDRERPNFRPAPAYANFLLLLATFYMASISPETNPADRFNGNPQFYSRSQNLGRSLLSWKIIQER
jgi:hypothetical protein